MGNVISHCLLCVAWLNKLLHCAIYLQLYYPYYYYFSEFVDILHGNSALYMPLPELNGNTYCQN